METETTVKPTVRLSGGDGNVFVIGKVHSALKRAGLREEAESFVERARNAKSYDEVLQLCFKYADVE